MLRGHRLDHFRRLSGAVMAASLISCGGATAPVAPPVIQVPPLPVLTTLTVILAEDTVPASQSTVARVTAVDDRARPMTVGVIAWTSADPAIATVSPDGVVTARAPGSTLIRAVVGEVGGVRTVTVTPPPPGPLPVATLSLAPVMLQLDRGVSIQLTAVARDFAGRALADRRVTWTTSNDSIAIVSADGTVTGISVGAVIIEATSDSARGAASISVTPPKDSNIVITVATPMVGQEIGDTANVFATVRSARPLAHVVLTVAGREYPMRLEFVQRFGDPRPVWLVSADVSTVVFGPIALLVTAVDDQGRRGTVAVPVVRRPLVPGGNKAPPGNK